MGTSSKIRRTAAATSLTLVDIQDKNVKLAISFDKGFGF